MMKGVKKFKKVCSNASLTQKRHIFHEWEVKMRKSAIVKVFLAILFIVTAGCATMQSAGHKYMMKGQILDVSDGVAYLCIGSAEGAKEGQEFAVYRHTKLPYSGGKQASPSYKREEVGAVKIIEVVDVHYARANILRGDIKENDIAELSP